MTGVPDAPRALDASLIETAQAALARHEWRVAFDPLSSADDKGELGPEALGLLAHAAWWTGQLPLAIDAHERGFAAALKAGDIVSATGSHRAGAREHLPAGAARRQRVAEQAQRRSWRARKRTPAMAGWQRCERRRDTRWATARSRSAQATRAHAIGKAAWPARPGGLRAAARAAGLLGKGERGGGIGARRRSGPGRPQRRARARRGGRRLLLQHRGLRRHRRCSTGCRMDRCAGPLVPARGDQRLSRACAASSVPM